MIRVVFVVVACLLVACSQDRDDGTAPSPDETLPTLELTDETPELLLTWIEGNGATETGIAISEVPEASKGMVRVTTKDAGHGGVFYVADLRTKDGDGVYSVVTMSTLR